jgi:molybdate transport repressor ModE-like protein
MTRKTDLASHYSANELKQKYLKSKDPVESRRWHLLWKVSLGWTIKDSAVAVGISYDYAKEIVKKYNDLGETGVENLKSNHKRGKKSRLTKEQLENLGKE